MEGRTTAILVADDHEMIREGLTNSIGEIGGNFRVMTACNGSEVLTLLDSGQAFGLIILDLFMPDTDGFALVSEVCERRPDTPVVVLSASENASHMNRAIDAGAAGYIPKTHGKTLMVGALQLVLSGGTYIPPEMLALNCGAISTRDSVNISRLSDRNPSLTKRQLEILRLLARGQSNKMIARSLGLSEHTVKTHIRTIFKELKASNRTQAVLAAQKLKYLLSPESDTQDEWSGNDTGSDA